MQGHKKHDICNCQWHEALRLVMVEGSFSTQNEHIPVSKLISTFQTSSQISVASIQPKIHEHHATEMRRTEIIILLFDSEIGSFRISGDNLESKTQALLTFGILA